MLKGPRRPRARLGLSGDLCRSLCESLFHRVPCESGVHPPLTPSTTAAAAAAPLILWETIAPPVPPPDSFAPSLWNAPWPGYAAKQGALSVQTFSCGTWTSPLLPPTHVRSKSSLADCRCGTARKSQSTLPGWAPSTATANPAPEPPVNPVSHSTKPHAETSPRPTLNSNPAPAAVLQCLGLEVVFRSRAPRPAPRPSTRPNWTSLGTIYGSRLTAALGRGRPTPPSPSSSPKPGGRTPPSPYVSDARRQI